MLPVVILYAPFDSKETHVWIAKLRTLIDTQSSTPFTFVFRHNLNSNTSTATPLNTVGFGIDLAIRDSEYQLQDVDSSSNSQQPSSADRESHISDPHRKYFTIHPANSSILGVNVTRLAEKHPSLANSTAEGAPLIGLNSRLYNLFTELSYTAINTQPPVSISKDIGVRVCSHALKQKDPLAFLNSLTETFPLHYPTLCREPFTNEMHDEIIGNLNKHGLEPILLINGRNVNPRTSTFSLSEIVQTELHHSKLLKSFGLPTRVAESVSQSSPYHIAPSSTDFTSRPSAFSPVSVRVACRPPDEIFYLNNIETDKRFAQYDSNPLTLVYSQNNPRLRRNYLVFTAFLDFSKGDTQFQVSQMVTMIDNSYSLRFAVCPAVIHSAFDEATGASLKLGRWWIAHCLRFGALDAANVMLNLYNQGKGSSLGIVRTAAIQGFSRQTATVGTLTQTGRFTSEEWTRITEGHDPEVERLLGQVNRTIERTRIPVPCSLFNGILLPPDNVFRDIDKLMDDEISQFRILLSATLIPSNHPSIDDHRIPKMYRSNVLVEQMWNQTTPQRWLDRMKQTGIVTHSGRPLAGRPKKGGEEEGDVMRASKASIVLEDLRKQFAGTENNPFITLSEYTPLPIFTHTPPSPPNSAAPLNRILESPVQDGNKANILEPLVLKEWIDRSVFVQHPSKAVVSEDFVEIEEMDEDSENTDSEEDISEDPQEPTIGSVLLNQTTPLTHFFVLDPSNSTQLHTLSFFIRSITPGVSRFSLLFTSPPHLSNLDTDVTTFPLSWLSTISSVPFVHQANYTSFLASLFGSLDEACSIETKDVRHSFSSWAESLPRTPGLSTDWIENVKQLLEENTPTTADGVDIDTLLADQHAFIVGLHLTSPVEGEASHMLRQPFIITNGLIRPLLTAVDATARLNLLPFSVTQRDAHPQKPAFSTVTEPAVLLSHNTDIGEEYVSSVVLALESYDTLRSFYPIWNELKRNENASFELNAASSVSFKSTTDLLTLIQTAQTIHAYQHPRAIPLARMTIRGEDSPNTAIVLHPADEESEGHLVRIVATVNPVKESHRMVIANLHFISSFFGSDVNGTIVLCPSILQPQRPIRSFFLSSIPSSLHFDTDDSRCSQHTLSLHDLPPLFIYTVNHITPPGWTVIHKSGRDDIDNVQFATTDSPTKTVSATFGISGFVCAGTMHDIAYLSAKGLPLSLYSTTTSPTNHSVIVTKQSTVSIKRHGYFQFRVAQPGMHMLSINRVLQPNICFSRFRMLRDIASVEDSPHLIGTSFNSLARTEGSCLVSSIPRDAIFVVNGWDGAKLQGVVNMFDLFSGHFGSYADREKQRLMEENKEHAEDTNPISKFVNWVTHAEKHQMRAELVELKEADIDREGNYAKPANLPRTSFTADTIHVFTICSGHLYERLAKIMMMSVLNTTKSPVKFWFIDSATSPRFRDELPQLAQEMKFDYQLVDYAWPQWLFPQTVKMRRIWAYKILFLDVMFPYDLERVIFADADQLTLTDYSQLMQMDLQQAPYAFTPMCTNKPEMAPFRFWESTYWKAALKGKPYHISALFVVDLRQFRLLNAGDTLRETYQEIGKDKNSLSNLDQDLPNFIQDKVPIHSLPQEWLWCGSWCSSATRKKAKTLDLCNNPKTKEHKVKYAQREFPEWNRYHTAVQRLEKALGISSLDLNATMDALGTGTPLKEEYEEEEDDDDDDEDDDDDDDDEEEL
ncbi:putative UDP-glucose:glycoprotein glucosyltransferase [Blattamonas nauphoetae]|uniref:UDP-glucose:glycoprotein glucosyltransferase n=1 Tax=Blattamonas nauphoetae TaxID=2049346 RepID=A0ABQ9XA78_9EUKA|nr:putative UDP-glucose:glycoprotein glucosyltransferase [Blattamonas nauphoetae]